MTAQTIRRACAAALALCLAAPLIGCGGEKAADAGGEQAAADQANGVTGSVPKIYGVKSGRITYAISGYQDGISTAQWDDWGMRESESLQSKTKFGGVAAESNQLSVRTPEALVLIDLTDKSATRVPNPIQEFIESESGADGTELGEKWLEAMGGERTGTDKVAGKTCDVWKVERLGGTLCIWEGLMLRQQVAQGDMTFTKVATAIDLEAEIDPGDLTVPDDITYRNGPTP